MTTLTSEEFVKQYVVNGKILPNDVRITRNNLDLYDNKITTMENIPDSVEFLDLGNNNITTIENIPEGVSELALDGNNISTVDNIPNSIEWLDLHNNPIYKHKKEDESSLVFANRLIKQNKIKKIKAL